MQNYDLATKGFPRGDTMHRGHLFLGGVLGGRRPEMIEEVATGRCSLVSDVL